MHELYTHPRQIAIDDPRRVGHPEWARWYGTRALVGILFMSWEGPLNKPGEGFFTDAPNYFRTDITRFGTRKPTPTPKASPRPELSGWTAALGTMLPNTGIYRSGLRPQTTARALGLGERRGQGTMVYARNTRAWEHCPQAGGPVVKPRPRAGLGGGGRFSGAER